MIELGYINKEQPLEEFVEKMDYNVSTVNRLSKKVKSKIESCRALPLQDSIFSRMRF